MNILVLAGGTSTERNVSIVTGTGVCSALREKGHRAILIDVFFGAENINMEDPFPKEYDVQAASEAVSARNPLLEERKKEQKSFWGPNVPELCQRADFVFLGLHGQNGEDGKIQAALDLMGVKYSGTDYLSSALAMDKGLTKTLFLQAGVATPKGVCLKKGTMIQSPGEVGLSFPLVIKASHGGSSIGVYIVDTQKDFEEAMLAVAAFEDDIIVEACITGTEYTVAVVDGEAYPIVEIVPVIGAYDYENKYKPGATRETCPAPLPEKITKLMQQEAVKGYRALGLQCYARLDFILDKEEHIYCLEANTLPGMTPTSLIPQEAAVLGMSYADLCEELIRVSMKKYL